MNRKSILIVDDNQEMKAIFAIASEISDIEIAFLSSGVECLEFLADNKGAVDAVLLDLSMNPMDGLTLAENIRAMEKIAPHAAPVKIAFYTAQIVDGVIERAADDVHATRIFTKPIDPFELILKVKEWLAQ